ncbi:MAG: LytR/AlgR family response regulator transcription factor [Bacteroidota bacterium]
MKLHSIGIDDDDLSLRVLEKLCSNIPGILLRKTFDNGLDAMLYVKNKTPDLAFLDVNMPEMSGLDIARQLPSQTMIVFITGYKEHALDAFQLNAIDYLLKPLQKDRFYETMHKVIQHKINQETLEKSKNILTDDHVLIKDGNHFVKVNVWDVKYLEAFDCYVKIHTTKQTHVTYGSLKTFDDIFKKEFFIRVHKSYIVSLNYMKYFTRTKIHLVHGEEIPLGRSYLQKFRESMKDKIILG